MSNLPPSPFTDSGEPVAPSPDDAVALTRSRAPGAAADIPEPSVTERRLSEARALEATDCIGQIFVGARKLLDEPLGQFDPAAITASDELLYEALKLLDDPRARDLPYIPDRRAFIEAIEPWPLFLQRARA